MKRLLFTFLFLTIAISGKSQNLVEGYVKDKTDNSFIPYCHVFIDSTTYGTISDTLGHFLLEIPDSLAHLRLKVKSLGYESYSAPVITIVGSSQVIYLNSIHSELPAFEISANREKKLKQKNVGSRKKKSNGNYLLNYGFEVALFFDNSKGSKGYISKVKYFISDKGFPNTPFRVRVYDVDKKTGNPGIQILQQNMIASGVNGNEWVVIDLSHLGIKIPKDGFFVAMEWLPVAEERNYNSLAGGQSLGGTHEFGVVSLTYTKSYLHNWAESPIYPNTIKQLNAKVAAELLVYKQKIID